LSLCLLSLGAPDMPLPALWLVVATLLAPKQPAPMLVLESADKRVTPQ
jgi:hypothetical protein